jgi:ketose-bisphosphate aldolase
MIINRDQVAKLFVAATVGKYAIPHFNHSDFWDMSAIAEASQESKAPIFIACLPKVIDAIGIEKLGAVAKITMEQSKTPIIYHLDHCHSVETCFAAIDNGYNSVMIDASHGSLEENIEAVKKVVKYAHERDVHVEAEVGHIKSAGDKSENMVDGKATVDDARILVKETGVDALAVAFGSEHGFYTHKPKLDFELLRQVRKVVTVPLVLHGGTGIPEEDVRMTIDNGIGKINIGTHIRCTYISSIKEAIEKMGTQTHTADIMAFAKSKVKVVVKEWIKACRADGKA